MNEQTFQQLQAFLVRKSGLYISGDRMGVLEEKVRSRLSSCGMENIEHYFQFLQYNSEGAAELKNLIDLLTVGETFFFRNQPQFNALREAILPAMIQSKGARKSLKIWCAGCSTGEEPYSLAILLNEMGFFDPSWKVSILATDINRRSLEAAQRGAYSERAVQEVPADQLQRYFTRQGRRYLLSDEIKSRVEFRRHNLVGDEFSLEEMRDLDVVLCRNVTIYFNLPTTQRLISQFADCLTPESYLFIGHAETLWGISEAFDPVEFPDTFVYRKRNPRAAKPAFSLHKAMARKSVPPTVPKPVVASVPAIPPARPVSSKPVAQAHRAAPPFDSEALLAEAQRLADQGAHEKALESLRQVVAQDNLCIQAYYLMGVLLSTLKRYGEAIDVFRKLLYIDGNLILSHYHLGTLYQALQDKARAEKEYSNCLKLLEGSQEEEPIPYVDGLTAGVLRQAVKAAFTALERGKR